MPRLGSSNTPPSSSSSGSSAGRRGTTPAGQQPTPSPDEILKEAERTLDANLFEPWYQQESNASDLERLLTSKFDYSSFHKISKSLQIPKVICVVGCVLCFGLAVSNFLAGRFPHVIIYSISAHDLLRVAYNCYIKRYCSRAVKRLGGNVFEAAANTFINAVNSALFGQPDLMSRLREEVMYDVLFDDTVTRRVMDMLPKQQIKDKAE